MTPAERLDEYRRLTLDLNLVTPPSGFNRTVPYVSGTTVRSAWEDYLASPANVGHNALYVHVPFCMGRKCHFCMYWSRVDPVPEMVERYLCQVEDAAMFYEDAFRCHPLEALYIGGGTPSLLTVPQLARLLRRTVERFRFQERAERTAEQSFSTTSGEKLSLLRESGITRLSFGLQSIEPAVLDAVGRTPASDDLVQQVLRVGGGLGFDEINVDLMVGLPNETPRGIARGFGLAVRSGASAITVYVHRHRVQEADGLPGRDALERFNVDQVPRMLDAVRHAAAEFGLVDTVADDNSEFHFFARQSHMNGYPATPYRTRFDAHHGNCVLGLGHTAISYILDLARAEYRNADGRFDPQAHAYAVDLSTAEQRRRLYVAESLARQGKVSARAFLRLFGIRFEDAFPSEIAALRSLGGLRCEGGDVSVIGGNRVEFAALCKFFWDQDYLRDVEAAT